MKRTEYDTMVEGPGKYEGENAYVPYFDGLDSCEDVYIGDDLVCSSYTVTSDDVAIFGDDLDLGTCVYLAFRSDGFVIEIDQDDFDAMQKDADDQPSSEDYIIETTGKGLSVGQVEGNHLGTFTEYDDAVQAIKTDMHTSSFFPNVFTLSDHGNIELITL